MEKRTSPARRFKPNTLILAGGAGVVLVGALAWIGSQNNATPSQRQYPLHQDITTTVFWVGEGADPSNRFIHNRSSTWTEDWVGAYGGIDQPEPRCGYSPCGFTPKENPFYFALPYSDLDESCTSKPSQSEVPWLTGQPPYGYSVVKNRWIKVSFAGKVAYAQWEDAGPFGEDDTNYVLGTSKPQARAGLDVSPATAEYLDLQGEGITDWQFIDENNVPPGPWLDTITKSPPDCAT